MSVQNIDTAEANEEALFSEKLEESLMSKEVILPILAIAAVSIVVWAIMTRCGKKSCCKKNSDTTVAVTRNSVKSSVKGAKEVDVVEAGSQRDKDSNMNTDISSAYNGAKMTSSIVKKEVNVELGATKIEEASSIAMPFDRASEVRHKPSSSLHIAGASS